MELAAPPVKSERDISRGKNPTGQAEKGILVHIDFLHFQFSPWKKGVYRVHRLHRFRHADLKAVEAELPNKEQNAPGSEIGK